MSIVTIRMADDNIRRFSNIIGAVGEGKARQAFARAINRTVDMVFTRTVRTLVKQTSAPRKLVVASLSKRKASGRGGDALEGAVVAKGRALSLKFFNPREVGSGTEVTAWGEKKFYEGAFFKSGWIKRAGANRAFGTQGGRRVVLGGHVYERKTESRLPLRRLFGPSIPQEMVSGASADAFNGEGAQILKRRVEHELGRLLP